jgi:hypothetical protein
MCFGFFQALGNAARFIFALVCCCLCAGPILIIIGIVLLSTDNTRQDDVDSYNQKVDVYNSKDAPILRQTTMSLGGSTMNRANPAVPIVGNTAGAKATSHYVFETNGVSRSLDDTYVVTLDSALGESQDVQFQVPYVRSVNRGLVCDRQRCTDDCGDNTYSCDESVMRSYCSVSFGGSYQDNSGACFNGDECGTCSYTGNLASACVVMAFTSDGRASPSSRYANCYYPFNEHEYLPGSAAATFQVMSEDDPFIELQRVTGGSNDFGITEGEQKNAGVACLIVGIIITVIMIAVTVFLVRRQQRKHEEQYMSAGPAPAQYGPQDPQPYGQPYGEPYPDQGKQPYAASPYPPGQQQGYNPQQQGYNPQQQGYNPQQQGYTPQQQGYNQYDQSPQNPQPAYQQQPGYNVRPI